MKINFEKYSSYKDSGVEWIGEIPEHWEVKKLRYISNCYPSNVDKHSKPNEQTVRLCNYTDVYNNEYITNKMDFMVATASTEQIKKFRLEKGDLIITKDSETPDDIAEPALVKEELDNVICGYHLTMIRPNREILSSYLLRLLQTKAFNIQFEICANGITRVGLGTSDMKSANFLLPRLPEQTAIANFLDRKTALIDKAIDIKKKQINLLKERRQILVHNAVTRGLDSHVEFKPSGVEWIGEIPEHWEVKRAKYLFDEIDERSKTGLEELLSVSHMTGVTRRSEKNVTMFQSEDYTGSKLCRKDDLIFNIMWTWMGALGVSDRIGIVSPSYAVYRQKNPKSFNSWFLEQLLRDSNYVAHYNRVSTGLHSSRLRFYSNMFFDMEIGIPPRYEQEKIVEYLKCTSNKIATAISLKEKEIEKLKEYKATLINSAVTGKIKVDELCPA